MKRETKRKDSARRASFARLLIPLASVLLTFMVLTAVFLLIGRNPLTAIYSFFQGSGLGMKSSYTSSSSMLTDFFSYLGILSPMLLGSLGVVVGLRGGLFNIGVSGQMLLSGFTATVLVGYSKLSPALAIPLVLLIGLLTGALLGAVIGWLKYRFNVHEVVSSIMFNYIVSFLTGYFIKTRYVDPIIRSSRQVAANARLNLTFNTGSGLKLVIPVGIFIAVAMAFLIRFYLERTVGGFEIRMVGFNRHGAAYAGVPIRNVMVRTMLISGALAGLAGVTYYLGYYSTMVPKDLPSLGYDAIAVALLGNLGPIGCIFSSALITVFQKGAVYMSSATGVVREIASLVTGILLLFSSLGVSMRDRIRHYD
ncbi:MAG: ABC transporter permease [Saccharofermentanales bacterium]